MTRDHSDNITEAVFRVYQDIIPILEPKVKNTILDKHFDSLGQVRCLHPA